MPVKRPAPLSIEQIASAIRNLSHDDYRRFMPVLSDIQKRRRRALLLDFSLLDIVEFKNKIGVTIYGKVTSFGKTNIRVLRCNEDGSDLMVGGMRSAERWRVSPALLTKVGHLVNGKMRRAA